MTSATHRYHPDPEREDPADAILYDDCERCDEHAKAPNDGLDAGNLYTLDQRRRAGTPAPTHNEMKAMNLIGQAVHMVRTIDAEGRIRQAAKEQAATDPDAGVFESILGQINAATANGFESDPATPAGSPTELWYRTERSRLVLRALDGADLHVFDGPIEKSLLSFSVRFDGKIPAEAFEAAVRGAM